MLRLLATGYRTLTSSKVTSSICSSPPLSSQHHPFTFMLHCCHNTSTAAQHILPRLSEPWLVSKPLLLSNPRSCITTLCSDRWLQPPSGLHDTHAPSAQPTEGHSIRGDRSSRRQFLVSCPSAHAASPHSSSSGLGIDTILASRPISNPSNTHRISIIGTSLRSARLGLDRSALFPESYAFTTFSTHRSRCRCLPVLIFTC